MWAEWKAVGIKIHETHALMDLIILLEQEEIIVKS